MWINQLVTLTGKMRKKRGHDRVRRLVGTGEHAKYLLLDILKQKTHFLKIMLSWFPKN